LKQAGPENIIEANKINLWFGQNHVLRDVTIPIKKNRITAIIGPSGCGKTTFIRIINRMSDLDHALVEGEVIFNGTNILSKNYDVIQLRTDIGMVFQKPNPFPKSIYDNIVFGPKINGIKDRKKLDKIVEEALKKAAIWDEVYDRLNLNALELSGGQQQRLCIARALAVNPKVMLYDEPCSALDPISTAKIEDLMFELKNDITQVIVTHNMQQAARVSDFTAFLLLGELIEFNKTSIIFEHPKNKKTREYISGKFG
jgi:phosphate transport system ATP-binding protein